MPVYAAPINQQKGENIVEPINWEAVSALSEAFGVVAVVASLIFVGFQIRQNAQATRAATMTSVMEQWAHNSQSLSENENLAEIVWNGVQDPNALSGVDRWRMTLACSSFLHYWHNAYFQWISGSLESNSWSAKTREMANLLTLPGIWAVWDERKGTLPEDFQIFIDTQVLTKSPDKDYKLSGT